MIGLIHQHRGQIVELCRQLNIRRLDVFGSAAVGEFDPERSDVDFIVEFDVPEVAPGLLSRYLSLAEQLERILGRRVDVITPQAIRNPIFKKAVDASREVVYAA